jgi:hypothetical protein
MAETLSITWVRSIMYFPTFVPPMMAKSTKAPFDSPDWIFEIKLDRYREITIFDAAGKPHLVAKRPNKPYGTTNHLGFDNSGRHLTCSSVS